MLKNLQQPSLFPSKYHYKIVKKKLLISIKHDLMIGRDMPKMRQILVYFTLVYST